MPPCCMPSSEYPHRAQEILNVFSSIVLQAFIITFLIIKKSPSPVPNKGNYIYTHKKRGTVCPHLQGGGPENCP